MAGIKKDLPRGRVLGLKLHHRAGLILLGCGEVGRAGGPTSMNDRIDLTSSCLTARHSGATVPEFHGVPSSVMIVYGQMPKSKNKDLITESRRLDKRRVLFGQVGRLLVESGLCRN